jgi:GT2 family glycosyltransferase
MGHGFRRRVLHRSGLSARQLLWASDFGVGANMAFRRDVFARIGGFDPALDVGTPSGGGGDIEMFHRLVASGFTLVYEPAALVWHQHRREAADLQRLVFNNGRTMGTFLLTCARNRTVSRLALLSFFVRQWLRWWLLRRLVKPAGYPRRLVMAELLGTVLSPLFYRAAQRGLKRVAR